MRLNITTRDTAPDDKEWATWAPFLTEREVRVYWALRAANGDDVDSSTLARGAAMGTHAFDRAIERLKKVGLLQTYDEA